MKKRNRDAGRTAASLLATCYVFAVGTAVCSFIVLAFGNDPTTPLLIVGGGFLLAFCLLWLLREKPKNSWLEGGYFWLLRKRPDDEDVPYTPRVIRHRPENYGTNEPPTAEEIRELAEGQIHWVSSHHPRKR